MKSFSVLTVSKRTGWEEIAARSMLHQTVLPEDWIAVTESQEHAVWDWPRPSVYPAPPTKRASNLNASLNAGLRRIKTPYVIFYQDFIELPADCFEKLLKLVNPRTFVTTCTPNYDGSDDGRYTGADRPRKCKPAEWEANVAIAPMKAIKELGGFDEEYDDGWSWDNVNLAERAELLGYEFVLDESNRPKLYPHEMSSHSLPLNGDRHARTMRAIKSGNKSIRCEYLR